MRLVGQDKAPIDMTKNENFEAFMKSMEKWVKENSEDKDGLISGWADIVGAELRPYGAPLVSA